MLTNSLKKLLSVVIYPWINFLYRYRILLIYCYILQLSELSNISPLLEDPGIEATGSESHKEPLPRVRILEQPRKVPGPWEFRNLEKIRGENSESSSVWPLTKIPIIYYYITVLKHAWVL